jgi:hypothetical protein
LLHIWKDGASMTWVMLSYHLPSEPSAHRVALWRKLKRLGALLLHDTIWVLPATPRTREQFQWLAVEARDRGGTALLWEGSSILADQDAHLTARFLAQVEPGYQQVLNALAQPEADLAALGKRYQQLVAHDYCRSPLGEQVRAALVAAQGGDAP